MRIEEPIEVVKAELEDEETRKLNEAIEVLSEIRHEMTKRNFIECICCNYNADEETLIITHKEIIKACEVLETLTLLAEMRGIKRTKF